MPLINCPECKSEISDTSLKCKNCGFPIKATLKDKSLKATENSTKQIIPKNWLIHVIISTALSVFAMVIAVLNSSYHSYEEEGVLTFMCTAFAYWIILSIIVSIKYYYQIRVKSVAKRFISKAWLRLHIILSIIGGCVPMIIYSIFDGKFDIEDWASALTWPIFYWLCLLILWGISKFNTAIISKKWLSIHAIISLCISIIVIIYYYNVIYVLSNGYTSRTWDDGTSMIFGQLSFIIYLIILFVSIWLINGFKQDDTEII